MKLSRARKYYARHKSMSMRSFRLECAGLSSLCQTEVATSGALNYLECGGKRGATPLWIAWRRSIQSAVAASLCRRTPNANVLFTWI
jgi:hypothetical protein